MNNLEYKIGHFHIFKNAGTSVDKALQKHFGDRWSTFEGVHAHDIKTSAELLIFFNDNPTIQAVSSHLCRPCMQSPSILPIVFIRDPLLRAKSVYEFTRNDPNQPFRESTTSSFSDYLKWALSGAQGGVVIRDYQVIHLSAASFHAGGILDAVATESNLNEAIQFIESWRVIGIVEKYAQSIKLIETVYRNYIPDLELTYEHENVTSTSQDVQAIKNEIGDALFQEFYRQNKFDYQLHEYACARLEKLCELHLNQIEQSQ